MVKFSEGSRIRGPRVILQLRISTYHKFGAELGKAGPVVDGMFDRADYQPNLSETKINDAVKSGARRSNLRKRGPVRRHNFSA